MSAISKNGDGPIAALVVTLFAAGAFNAAELATLVDDCTLTAAAVKISWLCSIAIEALLTTSLVTTKPIIAVVGMSCVLVGSVIDALESTLAEAGAFNAAVLVTT